MTIDDVKLKFKCRTCEQTESGDSSDEILCEICIQTHTRRKHDVLDYKDMKVVVCEKHLMYCGFFCVYCDRLICSMCVAQKHAIVGHKYVPVEQHANEIKKKIHEALSDIDEDYKPIVKNLAFAEKFTDQVGKLRSENAGIKRKILGIVRDLLEELNEEFETVSSSAIAAELNANKFVGEVKEIIRSIELKQSKLRELLSFSDNWLVQEFNSDSCDISNDEIYNNSIVSALNVSSVVPIGAEKNLIDSFSLALRNYANEVLEEFKSISKDGLDQKLSSLPADCTQFKNYPRQKVVMTVSDTHLCIAHFKENSSSITFEFVDKNDQKTWRIVRNIDSIFFRLFSCYGGVVFQTDEKSYQAFKIRDANYGMDGNFYLVDRWKVDVPNVHGFFNHKGDFYHHYFLPNSNWKWCFAEDIFKHMVWGSVEFVSVSTNMNPNLFYGAYLNRDRHIFIELKDQKGFRNIGAMDVPQLQPVTNIVFDLVENQPVVIAYSISENGVRFDYKQSFNGSFARGSGRTLSKSVDLKSVKDVQFFNSDCYFVTKEGRIIRYENFFGEL